MLEGRLAPLTPAEIEKAFARAEHEPTILAFASHDYRDIEQGIRFVQTELSKAAMRHPRIKWYYSDAAVAMRDCLGLTNAPHARFSLQTETLADDVHKLTIRLDRAPFGPQPWFCMATDVGEVYHDNLDFGLDSNTWHYTFDEHTIPLGRVRKLGVATNTHNGRTSVMTLEPSTGKSREAFLN